MTASISYHEALKRYEIRKDHLLPEQTLPTESLLRQYHPDYYADATVSLQIGVNKGRRCHKQLAALLQADSPINEASLAAADELETDVLVIGGGGAGCAAALTAARRGARVMLATKLRLGDSNTVMAEGGIQASVERNDSPQAHFDDTLKAGHFLSERDLVAEMVMDGPDVIRWLIDAGMNFDLDEYGDLLTRQPGGASTGRVLSCRDYTGLEMMRVLRESVANNQDILLRENSPCVELLGNEEGHCAGAVLYSLTEQRYSIIRAQAVILATGGIGRMHLNHFPTTNHIGATGDGLVLAYRLGARLRDLESFQYHPTTFAYPPHLSGSLITEGVRSSGVYLLNAQGQRFIDELQPRDCVSAAILQECQQGRGIAVEGSLPTAEGSYLGAEGSYPGAEGSYPGAEGSFTGAEGSAQKSLGVWLDTPGMELRQPGLLQQRFPKLFRLAAHSNIDPAKTPLLVYPSLHYQNGGVEIDSQGRSSVPGLYCAGEVSGGIHGHNRIMGNALLEIISFGRRSGQDAAARAHGRGHKKITLAHLNSLRRERLQAGIKDQLTSPLLFPACANFNLNESEHE